MKFSNGSQLATVTPKIVQVENKFGSLEDVTEKQNEEVETDNMNLGKELVAAPQVQEPAKPIPAVPADVLKSGAKLLNVHAPVFSPGRKSKSPFSTKQWVGKSFSKPVENVVPKPVE
ncbi:hypothetical protein K7X08_025195 [Anisodus acutangulus]|uniref:Uncharacterized protein n=1 Tax=Anisodus acutangulus TaxID=402998 RepID=A0A9Q1MBA4_9SOLA|nr:hypothetical protein K7X08_025195 [Anisodus acutangulus]